APSPPQLYTLSLHDALPIWKRLKNAPEHIKRKLPGMYHQFMQLAGVDITAEPMEVGPTTHYAMGGVLVEADSQMSTVQGLYAAGDRKSTRLNSSLDQISYAV